MFKNLKKKYVNMDIKIKASFWFMFCNILQKGVALLTTPIFTRILTSEQYGLYANYQSWNFIIIIFATLNLYGGVYNNGMIKYEKDRISFTAAIQGLSTTSAVCVFLIYILFHDWWNDIFQLTTPLMIMMFFEFVFSPAYSYWLLRNRFDYKYVKITLITVISTIINPLLAIIAIVNSNSKVEARAFCHTVIIVLFALYFYIYHFKKGKKFFDKEIWKFALNFNIPLIPHYLSKIVLQQSDRIMITRLVGTSQAAFYSVAYSISMLMYIVTNAINSTLIPYTYQAIKQDEPSRLKKNTDKIVLLVACGCLFAVLITPEIIRIFATEEYYDAIWVMPPVCISVYFLFICGLFSNVEFYFEKTKGIMWASIFAALLNVILNYLLLPRYGYYAAGYTTLVCYIIFTILHYIMYRRILKEKQIKESYYDENKLLSISVITVVGMILLSFTYNHTFIRYSIVCIVIVFALIKIKQIIMLIRNRT